MTFKIFENFLLTGVFMCYTLFNMNMEKLKIHGKFQSIMELSRRLDQTPKKFGTDELLTHTEIHLIEIIGDNENLSVTDIAGHLNITKGAVSQSLKRMEGKGLSKKETDPGNLSRSIVRLTSKGHTAYWAHKHWHETMDGGFMKYMEMLSPEKLEIIIDFLERVEDFLERRVNSQE